MGKILSVGEMVIDFLPGCEKDSYIRRAGGAPANVAIAAARLGCEAAFCGMLGADDFGRFLLRTLESNGVEPCVREMSAEATTTMAFVTLDEAGERSFTFARKPGADMLLCKAHITQEMLQGADIVHAGSCSLSAGPAAEATAYALTEGRRLGKLVSFDVNYRDLMWDGDVEAAMAAVRGILPSIDLLKLSEEEVALLGGEAELVTLLRRHEIALAVVTRGAQGACCFWRGMTLEQPGLPTCCVDSCGAGDAFWGAFLSTLLQAGVRQVDALNQSILREALLCGCIAGSLCVQKKGAIEALPSAQALMRRRKELSAT